MFALRVRRLSLFVLGAWLVFVAIPARACNVPVFRWALERWEPDPYEVFLFHRGSMARADRALVDQLERGTTANAAVQIVDLAAQPGEERQRLLRGQPPGVLPWIVVRYPAISGVEESAWSGPLSDDAVDALLDSPKRREIAQRLLDGEAAIWVLLESGDPERDDAAAKLLQTEIQKMGQTLELPQLAVDSGYSMWNTPEPPDLPIRFSLVRVSRTDPEEQIFIQMLLHSESDLTTFAEPMAFPIFGRGRALYALVGGGINEENIREACTFLVEACTCQVKAQSPGTDMLMSVDWEGSIEDKLVADIVLTPFPGLSEAGSAGADAAGAKMRTDALSSALLRNILLALGLLAVIVAAATLILLKRKATASSR